MFNRKEFILNLTGQNSSNTYACSKIFTTSSQPYIAGCGKAREWSLIFSLNDVRSIFDNTANFTCSVQRRPACLTLCPPDIWRCKKEVLHYHWISFPAADVERVPAILVSEGWVGAVTQELLNHIDVPPGGGHHQRSPES